MQQGGHIACYFEPFGFLYIQLMSLLYLISCCYWYFKAVDMRWGVRDEATDDHMTTELCMREIDNCQRLSTGPNFCVRYNSIIFYFFS
jgi:hypothetical protein